MYRHFEPKHVCICTYVCTQILPVASGTYLGAWVVWIGAGTTTQFNQDVTCIYTCMFLCVNMCIYTSTSTHLHSCSFTHSDSHIHMHLRLYMYSYACICEHTYSSMCICSLNIPRLVVPWHATLATEVCAWSDWGSFGQCSRLGARHESKFSWMLALSWCPKC